LTLTIGLRVKRDQHADSPWLLRARRERPRRRAKRSYQFPPSDNDWHVLLPREGCVANGTISRRKHAVFTFGRAGMPVPRRNRNDRSGCAPWKGGAFQWV
jgi:hypothetical protein